MPSRWSLLTLTSASSDTHPSFLAVFENYRYLFHAPEGASRAATQSRVGGLGVKKLKGVFLSGYGTQESGALTGMLLVAAEAKPGPGEAVAGSGTVSVHGPRGTAHLLASGRLYTRRDHIAVEVNEVSPSSNDPEFVKVMSDENLTVWALSSLPSPLPSPPNGAAPKRRRSCSRSPLPPAKRPHQSATDPILEASTSLTASVSSLDYLSPTFRPSALPPRLASTWRSYIVQDMFRLSGGPPRAPSLSASSYGESAGRTPAYNFSCLPSPDLPNGGMGQREVLSFLLVGPDERGRFLPGKAKALGVKEGPDFARLTKGERVWVGEAGKEGRWVEPSDVLEGGGKGSAAFIVNCPTKAHIAPLTSRSFKDGSVCQPLSGGNELKAVLHVAGKGVLDDPRYIDWVKTAFSASATHYVGSAAHLPDRLTYAPHALQHLRLSLLSPPSSTSSPRIFPLPHYTLTPSMPLPNDGPLSTAEPLYHMHRLPMSSLPSRKAAPDDSGGFEVRRFDFQVPSEEAEREMGRLKGEQETVVQKGLGRRAWVEYRRRAAEVVGEVEAEAVRRKGIGGGPADDVVVSTLGTGSAVPSKYRNVSATLIQPPSSHACSSILLDAGEGTLGQLRRRFGPAESDRVLRGLGVAFISHMHLDHHGGLPAVLAARRRVWKEGDQPLLLVAPKGVQLYLSERSQLPDEEYGLFDGSVQYINPETLRDVDPQESPPATVKKKASGTMRPSSAEAARAQARKTIKKLFGDKMELTTCVVSHMGKCFGLAVQSHQAGWKIVYSGDTRPNENLICLGEDADLLIHEATIDDSLPEVADFKGHSTVGQAIDVARRMKARHCLLTHFSSRYPKLPRLSSVNAHAASETSTTPVIAIAFDLMSIRIGDMWRVEKLVPALEVLFADGEEDDVVLGDDPHVENEKSGKEVLRPHEIRRAVKGTRRNHHEEARKSKGDKKRKA